MKILLQKLPLTQNKSFVARTYKTPNFEVPWHHHTEYELILFTSGEGLSFIGNHVGEFKKGDVFFLGKDLPHTFQKSNIDQFTSAIVVQFNEYFWGNSFLEIPESNNVVELFKISTKGLKVHGQSKRLLTRLIKDLEHANGFDRIICLCKCLNILAKNKDFNTLSSQHAVLLNQKNGDRIEKIIQYIITNYHNKISLDTISDIAGMTPPAFCYYFKKTTKKTYVTFLNEVRIGAACKKLTSTDSSIVEICYDTGFNTIANFNSQFLKINGMSPLAFRKSFKNSMPL